MRKSILALTVVLAMALFGVSVAGADIIQFPYVNSNPANLSTFISVINEATITDFECDSGDTLRLHYIYVTKSVDAAHTDACEELDFDRPTTPYDIVTFDFAGNINGGLAMFNDATSYAAGVGNPNFDLPTLGTSEPRRGYVLVNHRCVNGGDRSTDAQRTLDGEAMLFDVVNGAAWNYAALLANQGWSNEVGSYGFTNRVPDSYAGTEGDSLETVTENDEFCFPGDECDYGQRWLAKIPILPPNVMSTRMLVTPQMIASNVTTTNQMNDVSGPGQKRTRIAFLGRSGANGMTNRNEDAVSGGGPVHVRCVAGINISDILGLAATTIQDEGGWVYVDLLDPTPLSGVDTSIDGEYGHAAVVFKLEFGAPTWSAGSMINAARQLRIYREYEDLDIYFEEIN